MKITLIAAVAKNGVIGREGKLPWRIPSEMKLFREYTMGKPVIMGFNTAQSVGPLEGRINILFRSRIGDYPKIDGFIPLTFAEIYQKLDGFEEVMVIGGTKTYEYFMPFADKMVISHLERDYEGDAIFPIINHDDWHTRQFISAPGLFKHYHYTRIKRHSWAGNQGDVAC